MDSAACKIESDRICREEPCEASKDNVLEDRPKLQAGQNFASVYAQTSLYMTFFFVTTIYTQSTSKLAITSSMQQLVFTLSSIALKIVMQAMAKYSVFKQRLESSAAMATVVGVPTILIDMQMRIVLLRAQNTGLQLSGTLAMAAVEVCIRCAKSFYVTYKIKKEKRKASSGCGYNGSSDQHWCSEEECSSSPRAVLRISVCIGDLGPKSRV